MARTTVMTERNYGPGSSSFGPVAISDSLSSILLAVGLNTTARPTIFPSATAELTLSAECSVNNGPWEPMFTGVISGGISLDKFGNEIPEARVWAQIPSGINRRIQGRVGLTERQRISASVEVL